MGNVAMGGTETVKECLIEEINAAHTRAYASHASRSSGNMPWSSSIFIYGYLPSTEYVTQNASRQIVLVMMLLCYHLWFQIDFACPCTAGRSVLHCYCYMVMPSLIIVSIIMWNDQRIGRIFRYFCYHSSAKKQTRSCHGKFCCEFIIYFLQAAASGLLWCGSVLVDGDWYVCCGSSEEFMTLSCLVGEGEIGPAEKARTIHLKNQSMVIGLACILLTIACSFVFALPWSRWCTRRNHFRAVFEETILEQTEIILLEMRKAAASAVTQSLANVSTTESTDYKKNKNKDNMLLNMNVNWDQIACLTDALIESIPNNLAKNTA